MDATSIFNNFTAALGGAATLNLHGLETRRIKTAEEIRNEWLALRRGKFTASEFHRIMTYQGKAGLPAGAKSYAEEKAIERLTEFTPDGFVSADMQWGIDNEADAIEAFSKATGHIVTATGQNQAFLALGADIGGTPDGIIPVLNSGVEVKCPKSKNHVRNFLVVDAESLKTESPEYYWQVQGLMMISGSKEWYFISYDPRFLNAEMRLYYARIDRVETDIHDLRIRLDLAIQHRNDMLHKLREWHERQNRNRRD